MDGNGRWAKNKRKPRVFGHKAGMDALKKVTIRANEIGVKVLTVYAFSTENWSRPESEVEFIMRLPIDFYENFVPELKANNVKVQMMGDLDGLPVKTKEYALKAEEATRFNTGLILNFALNYGGRVEIVDAIQDITERVVLGEINPGDINEALVSASLMTNRLPIEYRNPDLLIRTSGEHRLSNFLLWQVAYTEFYFTQEYWPDFDEKSLDLAINDFQNRDRRFGGLTK
ncbi:isoprenyl transferase [Enterococcus sp. MMGLQ5-2]|nr:isoprenyl transferase [Enterococcus sp. MMGLQ5-2]MBS7584893.1 isoprenyl transferase [Enterococcus sp. MMGLQ5-1]NPD12748.1 isoprenyl transferase [Enterococcus sp. MMGLQ5-1]NPD37441.1 isoprenyl transferase [Enterococcus sp. MMGLQ5-2]